MPQMSNVVLKDHADANVTFAPRSMRDGVALWINSQGVPVGDGKLMVSRSTTQAGREKVYCKLTIPVVQDAVINGISKPTVVRTAYAELSMSFDATSNVSDRASMVKHLRELLNAGFMWDVTVGLETLF